MTDNNPNFPDLSKYNGLVVENRMPPKIDGTKFIMDCSTGTHMVAYKYPNGHECVIICDPEKGLFVADENGVERVQFGDIK